MSDYPSISIHLLTQLSNIFTHSSSRYLTLTNFALGNRPALCLNISIPFTKINR